MFKKVIAVVVAIALLGIAGCGGGGDDGSSSATVEITTTSLSKAEFVKQANNACAGRILPIQDKVKAAIVGSASVESAEDVVLPAVEGVIADLQKIGAPQAQQAEAEALLAALQENLESAKAKPSKSMEELAATFKSSGDLARQIGIETCAFG